MRKVTASLIENCPIKHRSPSRNIGPKKLVSSEQLYLQLCSDFERTATQTSTIQKEAEKSKASKCLNKLLEIVVSSKQSIKPDLYPRLVEL